MRITFKRIISVFIITIYLTSVMGYGVHICDNDGSIEVVSLINKSASCSDIHSHKDGRHTCAGCKNLLHKKDLENKNNVIQNAEHILVHSSDCCTSATYRLDISEKINLDYFKFKIFPQSLFVVAEIFNIPLKLEIPNNSLKNTQYKEYLIQSNIFKDICSYII